MKKKTKLLLGLGFASVALISIPTAVVLTSCAGSIEGVNFTNNVKITAKEGNTAGTLVEVNQSNIKDASNSSFTILGNAGKSHFFEATLPTTIGANDFYNLSKDYEGGTIEYALNSNTDSTIWTLTGNVLKNTKSIDKTNYIVPPGQDVQYIQTVVSVVLVATIKAKAGSNLKNVDFKVTINFSVNAIIPENK